MKLPDESEGRWADVLKKIYPMVVRYLTRPFGETLAEDAALSALGLLVVAVRDGKMQDLAESRKVYLWLRKVAAWRAIDKLRKEHARQRTSLADVREVVDSSEIEARASLELAEHLRERFATFKAQAGDDDLNALLDGRLEGLTLLEIATRRGWPPSEANRINTTLCRRLHRFFQVEVEGLGE